MHKSTQAKAQSANKPISDYFPLRCFLAVFIFARLKAFRSFFVAVKFLNKEV